MSRRSQQPAVFRSQLELVPTVVTVRPEAHGADAVRQAPQRYASEPGVFFTNPASMAQYLRDVGLGETVKLAEIVRERDYSSFGGTKEIGRRPIAPWVFIGLIAYGLVRGLSSLRELERLALIDLGALYICGGIRPDHSTIGLFLNEHAALLTEGFFVEVTAELVARLRVTVGTTAIDGTIVQAVASAYRRVSAEAAKLASDQAREEAAQHPNDARAQQVAELACEVAIVAGFRQTVRDERDKKGTAYVSPTEPDAVYQPLKQGPIAASYKPSIQVHEDGLIVGVHLDASSEQAAIAPLLEQHDRIFGGAPLQTLLDAGYHDPGTLQQFVDRDVDVLCPAGKERSPEAKQSKLLSKADFKYDESSNTYICPQGRLLPVWDKFTDADGRKITRFKSTDCSGCPLRPDCCKGKGNRSLKRYEGDDLKQAAASILNHPEAKRRYAQRKRIVEPVFGRLKMRQGLRRFLRRGREGVALEFALHCLAYNLGLAARRLARALLSLLGALLALAARVLIANTGHSARASFSSPGSWHAFPGPWGARECAGVW